MKKYIIANLKMNQTYKDTKDYLINFLPRIKNVNNQTVIGICFPYTSLQTAKELAGDSGVLIGAQNVHQENSGAYTGEVSVDMLKALGVDIILLGHSERRSNFGETNMLINKKIKKAMEFGFKVIYCYGESRYQRNAGKALEAITTQLQEGVAGLYENELQNIIFAYEPVWAIGTGKSATPKQIEEVAAKTREILSKSFSEKAGKEAIIIYGGSIVPKTSKEYIKAKGINGALIGGASLNPESFEQIIKAF